MTKLLSSIVGIQEICEEEKKRMYELLKKYYECYEYKNFVDDLEEKHRILLLRDPGGRIQGFTTLMFMDIVVDNQLIKGVFSGDTIVEKKYWGNTALHKKWATYTLELAMNHDGPFYWFFICSGYKTYRLLSRFFREYFPSYKGKTPAHYQKIMDAFAQKKFQHQYDKKSGTISFDHSQEKLKSSTAPITKRHRKNRDVAFFEKRNPQHTQGSELVCLTRIHLKNYRWNVVKLYLVGDLLLKKNIFNYLFKQTLKRSKGLFEKGRLKNTQEKVLQRIIKKNVSTDFGRKNSFQKIKSVAAYRKKVKVQCYEDVKPYIAKIKAGRTKVLTVGAVTALVPSSGSTSASKEIPYTRSLKKEFQHAIYPWLYNLFDRRPKLMEGKMYWSITPVTHAFASAFEEESAYFGLLQQWCIKRMQVVPSEVKYIEDFETFRYVTLLFLLGEEKLYFLSVWNPTFLMVLIKPLLQKEKLLIHDLKNATISKSLPQALKQKLKMHLRKKKKRAYQIAKWWEKYSAQECVAKIFKSVQLISLWKDGESKQYVSKIKSLFPQAELQGKGLMATEGVVSIPLFGSEEPLLAYRSHFFEFVDELGNEYLAYEIEKGKVYEVLLTTSGGLYRYALKDRVLVVGFAKDIPLLTFQGKSNRVTDLTGEKVHADHVQKIFMDIQAITGIDTDFLMVAPTIKEDKRFYALYVQTSKKVIKKRAREIKNKLEQGLCGNFNYEYSRKLGQLAKSQVFLIEGGANESYLKRCKEQGQKLGNIKQTPLHKDNYWYKYFKGEFLSV